MVSIVLALRSYGITPFIALFKTNYKGGAIQKVHANKVYFLHQTNEIVTKTTTK